MSELYAITITGIVASDVGDPAHSWTDASLPDLVKSLFDRDVKSMLFATHHNGRIVVQAERMTTDTEYQPIDAPDKLIGDALDDANGFYEMFDGWEGVEERVERLHQAFDVMNKNEAKKYAPPEISPAAQEELDKAFAKVRPDLYSTSWRDEYLNCPECGELFKRHHKLQKYCSATCRKRRNVRVAQETAKEVNSTVEVLNRIV